MTEEGVPTPYPGPLPLPTPEHQHRITRQKWFEIVTVVVLIAAGLGFLWWRDYRSHHRVDPALTMSESGRAIEDQGCGPSGKASIQGRQFWSFARRLDGFECHVDLIGVGADQPLETAVIWLTPLAGQESPSEESLQRVVNTVGHLGQTLVASSTQALETASKTMEWIGDAPRPHEKGVAGTKDGWKLTYVTYREHDDSEESQPMLCLVLQRLTAASEPGLSELNRGLHQAVHEGVDIKTALQAAQGA